MGDEEAQLYIPKNKYECTRLTKEKYKVNNELKLRRVERDESRVESMKLEDKLKAC